MIEETNVIQLGRMFPKCSKVDCHRIPGWSPVLILRPPAVLGNGAAQAELPLKFCHTCRLTTGWQDLVTDEGWAQICQSFHDAGRPPPERSRTGLQWRKLK
jgi:hypothetical protein